ncbi:MAG: hypothetical protein Q8L52_03715 [bacterium]|nr:hypothetical protein [bacterium]
MNIRLGLVIVGTCAAMILSIHASAHVDLFASARQQLISLGSELKIVDDELALLVSTYTALKEERKRLFNMNQLLTDEVARHKNSEIGFNQRRTEYDSAIENYNGRCVSIFSDAPYVAACHIEFGRLQERRRGLNDEAETRQQTAQKLWERIENLDRDISQWTQKVKSFHTKRNGLIAKRRDLLLQIHNALEELKRWEGMSGICPETFSPDGVQRCLQKVLEGAK